MFIKNDLKEKFVDDFHEFIICAICCHTLPCKLTLYESHFLDPQREKITARPNNNNKILFTKVQLIILRI